jgi:hypothetical protein
MGGDSLAQKRGKLTEEEEVEELKVEKLKVKEGKLEVRRRGKFFAGRL